MLRSLLFLALIPSPTLLADVEDYQRVVHDPRQVCLWCAEPEVAEEIDLLSTQRGEIKALYSKYMKEHISAVKAAQTRYPYVHSAQDKTALEQNKKHFAEVVKLRATVNAKWSKELATVLLPQQIQRLNELQAQHAGFRVFLDPPLQKVLNLTEAQRAQIQEIDRIRVTVTSPGGGLGGVSGAKTGRLEREEAAIDSAMSLLNKEQKATLNVILGKPSAYVQRRKH